MRYHAAEPVADAVRHAAQAVGADAIVELAPLRAATAERGVDDPRTGRLPRLKIGRALRFSRTDLEAHLAERCRAEVAARP